MEEPVIPRSRVNKRAMTGITDVAMRSKFIVVGGLRIETKAKAQVPKAESCLEFGKSSITDYDIRETIGEGTSGIVKKAYHEKRRQFYAIKIVKTHDPERIIPQINEYMLISKLLHPNIIRVNEIFVDEKGRKLYLVMEYFDGETLETVLEREGKLDEKVSSNIAKQMFKALEYLHEKGICHRDIHPGNIMVLARTRAKLIDFNVAKYYGGNQDPLKDIYISNMMTKTGNLFYRAPEVILDGGYNEKVDIWGLGLSLFKMIMGFNPFELCPTEAAIIEMHARDLFNFVEIRAISNMLRSLLRKLLDPRPECRPSAKQTLGHPWFVWASTYDPNNEALKKMFNRATSMEASPMNTLTPYSFKSAPDAQGMFVMETKNPWELVSYSSFESLKSITRIETELPDDYQKQVDAIITLTKIVDFLKGKPIVHKEQIEPNSAGHQRSLSDFEDDMPKSPVKPAPLKKKTEIGFNGRIGKTEEELLETINFENLAKLKIHLTQEDNESELIELLEYNKPYMLRLAQIAKNKPKSFLIE